MLICTILPSEQLGSRGTSFTPSMASKEPRERLGSGESMELLATPMGTSVSRGSGDPLTPSASWTAWSSEAVMAEVYSHHSTSHSYAFWKDAPMVMTPLGPGILSFR